MEEMLTPYQKMCYGVFMNSAQKSAKKNYKLREWVEKAHMNMLAEVYIATVWMTTMIMVIVGIVLLLVSMFVLTPMLTSGPVAIPAFIFLILNYAVFLPLCVYTYFIMMSLPRMRAKSRGADIDIYIPYAANFIAAMSAANATPQNIFKSLSTQGHIYGEISNEFKYIYRDMNLLGTDLLTALKRAVKRSPSTKFQEFVQGIIGTLTAGGDLKLYFLNRGEYYMVMNRREQSSFLETLAFIAESYVIVAVAMPMFLMIILVITYWISGSGFNVGDTLMYLVAFVMLPVTHLGYVGMVKLMTPKV